MSVKPTFLNDELYDYLLTVSVRDNALIQAGNALTDEKIGIPMQSSPEQLNFLNWLVTILSAKNILEIGTYTGLSALAMALALTADGKLICLDHSAEFTALAKTIWEKAGVAKYIELHIGEARKSLAAMSHQYKEYFDLIFIDADKSNNYFYYEKGLALLKQGGVIMIDNVLWNGAVIDLDNHKNSTMAIREFNQLLYRDERIIITLLPFGDGLTLATKL